MPDYLLTPPLFEDEDKTLAARLLFIILWTLMVAFPFSLVIAIALPETILRWLSIIAVGEVSCLTMLILNRRGYTRPASIMSIVMIWGVNTGIAFTGGGIYSNAIAIYLIVIFIAGLLLGGKAGIITAVLCSGTGLALVFAEKAGILPPSAVHHTAYTQWVAYTIYMFIIVGLQYLASQTIEKSLQRSRQELAERRNVERALRESEEKYRLVVENAQEAIIIVQDVNLVFFNRAVVGLTGYSEEILTARPFTDFIHPDDRDLVISHHLNRLAGKEIPQAYSCRVVRQDGTARWTEIRGTLISWQGKPATLNLLNDVTETKKIIDELKESEERFRSLFDRSLDCLYIHDFKGQFIDANPSALNILGFKKEEIPFLNFAMLISDDQISKALEVLAEVKQTGFQKELSEFRVKRADGGYVNLETKSAVVYHAGKPAAIMGVARDITERKRMEEELRDLSFRDQLTELYNRRGFITMAEQQIKTANRVKRRIMLSFFDVDDMKGINDTLGHEEGDKALIDTANIFRRTFRESDIIARMGGDEFAVLAIDMTDLNPEVLSKRLQKNLDDWNAAGSRQYKLAISWGTSIYDPESPISLDQLMSVADELMYKYKKANLNKKN